MTQGSVQSNAQVPSNVAMTQGNLGTPSTRPPKEGFGRYQINMAEGGAFALIQSGRLERGRSTIM